ncbi:hypothetical protein O0L34_g7387 [Tuta absoluta]|nr:hypothetical protein O0L34_g7387 [Tuta absoluta]
MATKSELFLFEVVLEKIQYFVDDREIAIKFDFAKIFSLDLKDPKSLHIQIPEPLPLPPEPPGKKKKKKKKPKPKKKKKGKKGKEPPPPPEPEILVGQSMLVTSSAEVLVQNMRSSPMVVSLYSKEDTLVYIGSSIINWDEVYLKYLENIYSCKEAQPVWVKDEYNIFEENTAKLVAKITLKVTLTYLTDRVTSSFRTLTEDDVIKKVLYTGMNSRKTSVMCTLKTSEGEYKENLAKIPNRFVLDKPPPVTDKAIAYADYTNAPGVALPYDLKNDYCCLGNVDKPPALKYETPEGLVDIDYICDYIRKIISSCNDNMRMLRPQPTIRPRVRATDLDKLCYCKETAWPKGDLAERFRRETQGGPCPVCVRQLDGKPRLGTEGATKRVLDVANIRGPCGRPDCRIARDIRAYLEKLVEEDNKEIRLEDIIGPCGSKECTLVDKIKDFLTHRGKFSHEHAYTKPGLSTVCACLDRMQNALIRKGSCSSICSHDCESESDNCEGKTCPYRSTPIESSAPPPIKKGTKPPEIQQPKILHDKDKNPPKDNPKKPPKPEADKKIYYVYYFTVEYDNKALDPTSPLPTSPTSPESPTTTPTPSLTSAPTSGAATPKSTPKTPKSPKSGASTPVHKKSSTKFKHCARLCPTALAHKQSCSRSVCGISETKMPKHISASCTNVKCPSMEAAAVPRTPSPADSNVELKFDEIRNPCCVKSCEVSERVKDLICEGLAKKSKQTDKFDDNKDPCFCDCVCEFPMGGETTYCNICGGYETLGKAVSEQPAFLQPHPCPVYHKLQYMAKAKADALAVDDDDTRSFKGKSVIAKQLKVMSSGSKTEGSDTTRASVKGIKVKSKKDKKKKGKKSKEPSQGSPASRGEYHKICHMYLEQVPKNMGWLWNAEDIPGLKDDTKSSPDKDQVQETFKK